MGSIFATKSAVADQIAAMGADRMFEVGVLTRNRIMLLRSWDESTIEHSIPWLRHENARGGNIYIRPKGEHDLTLVDDLNRPAIDRMKASGFEPAAVIETSPGNFQAWLKHPAVLPKHLSTAVARAVAEMFGADLGSADWRHFGRAAGFTNQKPKYRQANGLNPYVRLIEHTGRTYSQGPELIQRVEKHLEEKVAEEKRMHESRTHYNLPSASSRLKSIQEFRADPKYQGDGKRSDLAYAIYALAHGLDSQYVESAIRSRDLSHKGTERRQNEYVQRTIKTALTRISGRGR
jgi:hypothetical protein